MQERITPTSAIAPVAGRSCRGRRHLPDRDGLAVLLLAAVFASTALGAGKGHATPSGRHAGAMGSVPAPVAGASAPAAGRAVRHSGGGMAGRQYRTPPELEPTRKISEQDCTRPIVIDGGNLRCK